MGLIDEVSGSFFRGGYLAPACFVDGDVQVHRYSAENEAVTDRQTGCLEYSYITLYCIYISLLCRLAVCR